MSTFEIIADLPDGTEQKFVSEPGESRSEFVMRVVNEFPQMVLTDLEWERQPTMDRLDREYEEKNLSA